MWSNECLEAWEWDLEDLADLELYVFVGANLLKKS